MLKSARLPGSQRQRVAAIIILLLGSDYLFAWLAGRTPSDQWGPFRAGYVSFAHHFGFGATVAALGAALWCVGWLWQRRPWEVGGRWLLWSVLLSGFWAQAIKHLVGRPRPRFLVAEGWWLPMGPTFKASWDSFPSGHAMTAFAAVPLLEALFPGVGWVWAALASSIAFGRVVGCDHYLTDVVVGALLGTVIGRYVRQRWAAELDGGGRP